MRPLTEIERSKWCQHPKSESAIACVLALALAFVIRLALHPYLDDGLPTLAFTIATIIVAYRYGYLWGMGTLIVGFVIATYFFIKPYNSFEMPSELDLYRMLYYFSITTLIVIVMEKTNRDKYESEMTADDADRRYREMIAADRAIREQHFTD